MKSRLPIYNLLCQEIKACAEHLLEICKNQYFNEEMDSKHIISRLNELHQYSEKIRMEDHYHPLSDLKHYLESTMLSYPDANNSIQTMRLSEALSLLQRDDFEINYFKPEVTKSLYNSCWRHCREEIYSGRRLHQTLHEIRQFT